MLGVIVLFFQSWMIHTRSRQYQLKILNQYRTVSISPKNSKKDYHKTIIMNDGDNKKLMNKTPIMFLDFTFKTVQRLKIVGSVYMTLTLVSGTLYSKLFATGKKLCLSNRLDRNGAYDFLM